MVDGLLKTAGLLTYGIHILHHRLLLQIKFRAFLESFARGPRTFLNYQFD